MLKRVEAALQAGVTLVQYRRKQGDDRLRLQEAGQLAELCRSLSPVHRQRPHRSGTAGNADGVHLGQPNDLQEARGLTGQRQADRSQHPPRAVDPAQEDGYDYVDVDLYARTKAERPPAGLAWVRKAKTAATVPWFAIGGIDASTIAEVRGRSLPRCRGERDHGG